MLRQLVLVIVLVFTLALAGLTIQVVLTQGVDVLTLLSLLVIALFGFGILGALRHPPDQ